MSKKPYEVVVHATIEKRYTVWVDSEIDITWDVLEDTVPDDTFVMEEEVQYAYALDPAEFV